MFTSKGNARQFKKKNTPTHLMNVAFKTVETIKYISPFSMTFFLKCDINGTLIYNCSFQYCTAKGKNTPASSQKSQLYCTFIVTYSVARATLTMKCRLPAQKIWWGIQNHRCKHVGRPSTMVSVPTIECLTNIMKSRLSCTVLTHYSNIRKALRENRRFAE